MGDWRVLNAWNQSTDGFHDCARTKGGTIESMLIFMCFPVVEQHQQNAAPDVPEVTVKTRYSSTHAWTYEAMWNSVHGVRRVRSGTGYPSREMAKEEAEEAAINAILEEFPEETYTFTPKI